MQPCRCILVLWSYSSGGTNKLALKHEINTTSVTWLNISELAAPHLHAAEKIKICIGTNVTKKRPSLPEGRFFNQIANAATITLQHLYKAYPYAFRVFYHVSYEVLTHITFG
jgi:hypothetical protein